MPAMLSASEGLVSEIMFEFFRQHGSSYVAYTDKKYAFAQDVGNGSKIELAPLPEETIEAVCREINPNGKTSLMPLEKVMREGMSNHLILFVNGIRPIGENTYSLAYTWGYYKKNEKHFEIATLGSVTVSSKNEGWSFTDVYEWIPEWHVLPLVK